MTSNVAFALLAFTVLSCAASRPCPEITKVIEIRREVEAPKPEIAKKDENHRVECLVWSPMYEEMRAVLGIRQVPEGILVIPMHLDKESADRLVVNVKKFGTPLPGLLGEMGWLLWCAGDPAPRPPPAPFGPF